MIIPGSECSLWCLYNFSTKGRMWHKVKFLVGGPHMHGYMTDGSGKNYWALSALPLWGWRTQASDNVSDPFLS